MSTALANPAAMIHQGAPRIIRNDRELEEYTQTLFRLTAKKKPTRDEDEAIELLTLLIEKYEAEQYPIPESGPAEVLKFLMESHSLNQKDLTPEFGAESTVSLVLSGKRRMNRDHIAALAKRFKVSPAVFF